MRREGDIVVFTVIVAPCFSVSIYLSFFNTYNTFHTVPRSAAPLSLSLSISLSLFPYIYIYIYISAGVCPKTKWYWGDRFGGVRGVEVKIQNMCLYISHKIDGPKLN